MKDKLSSHTAHGGAIRSKIDDPSNPIKEKEKGTLIKAQNFVWHYQDYVGFPWVIRTEAHMCMSRRILRYLSKNNTKKVCFQT